MASDTDAIRQIFSDQTTVARELTDTAKSDIQQAMNALAQSSVYNYDPYNWQIPSPPVIAGGFTLPVVNRPGRPADPKEPTLQAYNVNVPNPTFGAVPTNNIALPTITLPTQPGGEPTDSTGTAPTVTTPTFALAPSLLTLPSGALPYPSVTIPDAPVLTPPSFDVTRPDDISIISLTEYLQKLTDTYTTYSQQIPTMVQGNALTWFRAVVGENPNIRTLDGIVTSYLTAGGAGIPVPIEEAIVTRATDRASNEYRREVAEVWDTAAQRGLTLPSGVLTSGRKGARSKMSEGVAKVVTDVAIKNLELEHDHMKFMLTLGRELQTLLVSLATDSAKVMVECNGQAIELTKTVLQGMVEINNAIVRAYLAKWEGYKAGVEAFRAKISAMEAQVRVYEAEIRAELAKTEVNKATVEVLTAMVNGNKALVEMYKAQIDAETAKVEADRVRVMAYEAAVRGYVAKVDAYKARWDGYASATQGELAKAKVYEAQQLGYKAQVEGYTAGVQAYGEQVRGYSAQVEAVSKQNEAALKAWSIQWDGTLKAYSADIDAYGKNWAAAGEQMRAAANVFGIQSEFLSKMYTNQTQIEMERAREHFSTWQQRLRSALDAASGLSQASGVATALANGSLNSLSAFAGTLATSTGA